MDEKMGFVEDLSERSGSRSLPSIPRNIAIIIFLILAISGILVGAFLPGFIEGSEGPEGFDTTSDAMDALIASSIPDVEIAGTTYNNIPLPTAFQVLFLEGDPSTDYASMDAPIGEMMDYLLGEGTEYKLTITPGSGMEGSDYILGSGVGDPDGTATREVPVGLDEDEGSVVFDLRIWGWK